MMQQCSYSSERCESHGRGGASNSPDKNRECNGGNNPCQPSAHWICDRRAEPAG